MSIFTILCVIGIVWIVHILLIYFLSGFALNANFLFSYKHYLFVYIPCEGSECDFLHSEIYFLILRKWKYIKKNFRSFTIRFFGKLIVSFLQKYPPFIPEHICLHSFPFRLILKNQYTPCVLWPSKRYCHAKVRVYDILATSGNFSIPLPPKLSSCDPFLPIYFITASICQLCLVFPF